MEYLLRCGRYASCVHAGLSCFATISSIFFQYTDRCSECETDSDWPGESEPEIDGGGSAPWRLYNPSTWSARGVVVFLAVCWSLIILNVMISVALMVDDNTGSCAGKCYIHN